MIMKNGKEFDYDKKKPNLDKNNSKKLTEMKKEKSENLSQILDKSQNSKSIEVIQKDPIIKKKKKKKEDIIKISEEVQVKPEELKFEKRQENIIITLPETEIISPEIPLDEDKKPNLNFSKNLLGNMYDKQKSETNIGIIDGVEIGLNSVMDDIHEDHLLVLY